jgi:hypothetical protein
LNVDLSYLFAGKITEYGNCQLKLADVPDEIPQKISLIF